MRNPYGFELSQSCLACHFRKNGFFCQLSAEELAELDTLTFVSAYPRQAILFAEQEKSRGVYVVCEGMVKIFITSTEGRTLSLRIARRGAILGLLSVLTGSGYEASAATLQPSQVAFVSGGDFRNFLRKYPSVFQRVALQLGYEYQSACEWARAFDSSVVEKLAQFLLFWSSNMGASQDGMPFELPLSHEEIAEHVGAVRESVSRALGMFKRRGLLKGDRSTFTIPNRMALHQFRECSVNASPPSRVVHLPTMLPPTVRKWRYNPTKQSTHG